MRKSAASWTIKILLFLLVLSFISFYGWRLGQGSHSVHYAAQVNGDPIRIRDVQIEFEQMVQTYKQYGLLNGNMSDQMMGMIQANVLSGMIDRKVKVSAAPAMGIVESKEQVKKMIVKNFADKNGNFDYERYKMVLQNFFHTTPGDYEDGIGESLIANRFDRLFEDTSYVTEPELRNTYLLRNEKVNLSYAVIDPGQPRFAKSEMGSAADLEKYYQAHLDQYKVPEKREVEIAWIDVRDLADPSNSDLEAMLKENFKESDAAATGERIRAAHILLKISEEGNNEATQMARASSLLSKLHAGTPFADLARRESEDSTQAEGGDLGYFAHGQMVKEFDAAAFALKKGEVSGLVKTNFGVHIIQLLDRIAAGPVTVERLKPELVYRWKKKEADSQQSDKLFESAKQMLEGIKSKGGKSDLKSAISDPRIHHLGPSAWARSDSIPGVPDADAILRSAWELKPEEVGNPIRGFLSKNSYIVRLIKIVAPTTPPFSQVQEKVKGDYSKERAAEAAKSFAEKTFNQWKTGKKPFVASAKAEKLEVKETGDFVRASTNILPVIGKSETLMNEAFQLTPESPYVSAPAFIDGKYYLVALKSKTDPNWKTFETDKENLRHGAEEELSRSERLQPWTEALRKKAKIQRYSQATAAVPTED